MNGILINLNQRITMVHINKFLCMLSMLCVFVCPAWAVEDNFEQAYAPINVAGITIFVPIDLQPEKIAYLSVKETSSQFLIEWSPNPESNYFVLEQFINDKWQVVSNRITTNKYSINKINGSTFRVKGCHRYGCADWGEVNNVVRLPLQIASFSTNHINVDKGNTVVVSWKVNGASIVNLKVKNTYYKALPPSGSKRIPIHDFTIVELNTSGFGSTQNQQLAIAVNSTSTTKAVQLSGYLQPLVNLGLDIIERAILSDDNFTYVFTQDAYLHKVNNESEIVWSKKLSGVVANKPIMSNGYLYYSVSLINGAGELCKTAIMSAQTVCIETKGMVIASPVIMQTPSHALMAKDSQTQKSSYFTNNESNRLLSITTSGLVVEYDLETLTVTNEFAIPTAYQRSSILTNAKISENNELILRTDEDQLVAFVIPPTNSSVDKFLNTMKSVLRVDHNVTQKVQPKQLDIAWQKEL